MTPRITQLVEELRNGMQATADGVRDDVRCKRSAAILDAVRTAEKVAASETDPMRMLDGYEALLYSIVRGVRLDAPDAVTLNQAVREGFLVITMARQTLNAELRVARKK